MTRPGDDKTPCGIHRDGGKHLVIRRVRVDLKLRSLHDSRSVEAFGENPKSAAILAVASPRDHKISRSIHGDHGRILVVLCVSVYLELVTDCLSGAIISLSIDPIAAAVLSVTYPGHDRVTYHIHRDRWRALNTSRIRVDL